MLMCNSYMKYALLSKIPLSNYETQYVNTIIKCVTLVWLVGSSEVFSVTVSIPVKQVFLSSCHQMNN